MLLLSLGSVVKTNIKLTFSLRTALRALGFLRGGDGGGGGGRKSGDILIYMFLLFQRSDESNRRQAG